MNVPLYLHSLLHLSKFQRKKFVQFAKIMPLLYSILTELNVVIWVYWLVLQIEYSG